MCSPSNTRGTITLGSNTVTISYNCATETLTLTGYDTLAHYQTVLDQVQYPTPSDNPTNYGANPTRTITWMLDDGALGNPSAVTTTTLTVSASTTRRRSPAPPMRPSPRTDRR